ncbi:MAG: NAD(P)H-hydrate dehydratase [Eubacterium sp.]|nr:NAD(P)H-hydrate dehydratase [Eubacterium sp.]
MTKYLYSAGQAAEIDKHCIEQIGIPGMVLMEKAAMSVAAVIMERYKKQDPILIVCGPGNNGGDGVCLGRILHQQEYSVRIAVVGNSRSFSKDLKQQILIADQCHVEFVSVDAISTQRNELIVDALFGVGLSRDISGVYEQVIGMINASGTCVCAIDIPSGIHGTSASVMGVAVKADYTVTFGMNKIGLVLFPGCEYAGEVFIADIGYPQESFQNVPSLWYHYEVEDIPRLLPERKPYSNKGSYGKVMVIAGNEDMAGAALLAGEAAYRMGAGLVRIVSAAVNRDVILNGLPEALFSTWDELPDCLSWPDVVVLGPGIGRNEHAVHLVKNVLDRVDVPVVLDGDALWIVGNESVSLRKNMIVTPHVKEMSYLTGRDVSDIKRELCQVAEDYAAANDCVVVLKDARTIVSDGREGYINLSGNHGMATGGSGDVLTGFIAGLIAQNVSLFEAAKTGVYLHGLSGDLAVEQKGAYSFLARDYFYGLEILQTKYDK